MNRSIHFRFANKLLFFAADVLSEEAILKWYKEAHSSRGWSVFMDQMKKFVEWLEHAEEGANFFLLSFFFIACFIRHQWSFFCLS